MLMSCQYVVLCLHQVHCTRCISCNLVQNFRLFTSATCVQPRRPAVRRVIAYGWEPLQAVGLPRLHHQLLPHTAMVENTTRNWVPGAEANFTVSQADMNGLLERGNEVMLAEISANVQAIIIDPDTHMLLGASDPRKDGAPAGY